MACSSCNSWQWGPQWRQRRRLTLGMTERDAPLAPLGEAEDTRDTTAIPISRNNKLIGVLRLFHFRLTFFILLNLSVPSFGNYLHCDCTFNIRGWKMFLHVCTTPTHPLKCSWANLKSCRPISILSSPYWEPIVTALCSRWVAALFQSPTTYWSEHEIFKSAALHK